MAKPKTTSLDSVNQDYESLTVEDKMEHLMHVQKDLATILKHTEDDIDQKQKTRDSLKSLVQTDK